MTSCSISPDPRFDLVLERIVDVPRDLVWAAWTTPEHLKKWFTPAPWKTVHCEVDLRPGGIFHFLMESPEGQQFPHTACYLDVIPGERLIWCTALAPGYRPLSAAAGGNPFLFTAIITLESLGERTKYTATVLHSDEEACRKHDEMGFHQGWGAALDQMVALMS